MFRDALNMMQFQTAAYRQKSRIPMIRKSGSFHGHLREAHPYVLIGSGQEQRKMRRKSVVQFVDESAVAGENLSGEKIEKGGRHSLHCGRRFQKLRIIDRNDAVWSFRRTRQRWGVFSRAQLTAEKKNIAVETLLQMSVCRLEKMCFF